MGKTYKDLKKPAPKGGKSKKNKPSNMDVSDWMDSDDAKVFE